MYKKFSAFLLVSFLAACSEKPPLDLKLPRETSQDVQKLLTTAWPKIKENCPGLDRFSDALKFTGIENNYAVSIVYQIPESDTSIPRHYMAGGHTCYFSVSQDGKNLVVAKEGCKAVCLGRHIEHDEAIQNGDLVFSLVAEEKSIQDVDQNKVLTLNASQAKQLATETLHYLKQYKNALDDDAVMNEELLLKAFQSKAYFDLLKRWPPSYPGDTEAEKYSDCREVLLDAHRYAQAQHNFAFKGGKERDVIPGRRDFKRGWSECAKVLRSKFTSHD